MLVSELRTRLKKQGGSAVQTVIGTYLLEEFVMLDCLGKVEHLRKCLEARLILATVAVFKASIAVGSKPVVAALCPINLNVRTHP